MKKIFLPGLVASIGILAVQMAIGKIFDWLVPALPAEYMNPGLFRPWTDPRMMLYFVYPFIMGFLLAWVWNMVKGSVSGKSACHRGKKFGAVLWLALTVPGMWMTYSSFQVSFWMVLSWTVSGLIFLLLSGCIYAKMNP